MPMGEKAVRMKLAITFACVAAQLVSCDSSRANLDAERSAVLTAEREWAAAAKDRDLERSLSYLADDAMMLPPGAPPVVGKAAIRDYMTSAFATPGFSVTWEAAEAIVADSGDLAYTHGRSVYTAPGPDGAIQTTHGKGVSVWRKDAEGNWRCVVDIWNEAPPTDGQTGAPK
jgi:uncharacterized protein (TIGR02246 family)